MCMACPKRVVSVEKNKAVVSFQGEFSVVKTPITVTIGDYVLCQQDVAVQKVSESEAKDLLKKWKEMKEIVKSQL